MRGRSLDLLRDDVHAGWDPIRFAEGRLPVTVSEITCQNAFQAPMPSCLDMLVKVPGGPIVLPEPYASLGALRQVIGHCVAFEDALLPGWRESHHAYLTVDRRYVPEGRTHRNAGWHFDGMQGARYAEKFPACHQYVVCDRLPTEFACGPFHAVGLNETSHDWFAELGRQADCLPGSWRPPTFLIVAMSAYQVHRSAVAGPGESGMRTFLRFEVSMKRFDRLGNSVNPLLPAPWQFIPRPLPHGLGAPEEDAGWTSAAVRFGL